jgi:uncharacterized membrane protein
MHIRKAWDLLTVIALSITLILLVYTFPDCPLRKIVGLAFILFFPGYSLISFLFPKKDDLDVIERLALSFGMSIAVAPLIGLALNYTPFGIRLTPILLSLSAFNILFSILAVYRRAKVDNPFIPEIKVDINWNEMSKVDKVLTVILIVSVVLAISAIIYVVSTPKPGEKFTEFYILGPNGKAEGYPRVLKVGENASVIIGIANHEYRTVNYHIEVWLVSYTFNGSDVKILHMYLLNVFNVTLNHTDVPIEGKWKPQWEMRYNFSIDKKGRYKMWFLLFKDHEPPLPTNCTDYAGTYAEKRIFDAINGKILSLNLNIVVE